MELQADCNGNLFKKKITSNAGEDKSHGEYCKLQKHILNVRSLDDGWFSLGLAYDGHRQTS